MFSAFPFLAVTQALNERLRLKHQYLHCSCKSVFRKTRTGLQSFFKAIESTDTVVQHENRSLENTRLKLSTAKGVPLP